MRITVLLLAVALPLAAYAQPKQYFAYPPAGALSGTEVLGPIRQGNADKSVTVGDLTNGVATLVQPTIQSTVASTVNAQKNQPNGVAGTDAQNTISAQQVIPQGSTTPQPLSSVAGVAVNAFPRAGASMLTNSTSTNTITGAINVQHVPFGAYADATAATFNIGPFNGCVLGGAENGQNHGGIGQSRTIDVVTLCESLHMPPALFSASGTFDATHFYPTVPLTPSNLQQLHSGSVANHAGTWVVVPSGGNNYASWVTGYADDGTSVSVIGWWVLGVAGYQTPTGTLTASFGVNTRGWVRNSVIDIDGSSFGKTGLVDEMDVDNNYQDGADIGGIDAVALGSFASNYGYRVRGAWQNAYVGVAGQDASFLYDPSLFAGTYPPVSGAFVTRQTHGIAYAAQPGGVGTVNTFAVDSGSGSIASAGSLTLSGTVTKYAFPSPVVSVALSPDRHGQFNANNPATVVIDAPPAGGVQATAVPVYGTLNHLDLPAGQGGSGYTSGDVCALNGGTLISASPATVKITAVGGVVTAYAGNSNSLYSAMPPFPTTIACPSGGSGAQVDAGFAVNAITVTAGGSGYTSVPHVAVNGGVIYSGSIDQNGNYYNASAAATAVMNVGFSVDANNNLSSFGALNLAGVINDGALPTPVNAITVVNGGIYDSTAPATITIDAPPETGTQATAVVSAYKVQSVGTIANGGTGYTQGDTCSLVGGTFTQAGTLTIDVTSGVISAVHGGAGGAYSALPPAPTTINCPSGGSGASLNSHFTVSSVAMTNVGAGYMTTPRVTASTGIGVGGTAVLTANVNSLFRVDAAGVVHANGLQTGQYTIATLPACNATTDGMFAEVTNQSGTPTYGGSLTAGGALHWPVFCNGTAWTAH